MTIDRIRTEGEVEYRFTHPDDFREHVRDRKGRSPVPKLVTAMEAVTAFALVPDGVSGNMVSEVLGDTKIYDPAQRR